LNGSVREKDVFEWRGRFGIVGRHGRFG
jgi:hypothetical protein